MVTGHLTPRFWGTGVGTPTSAAWPAPTGATRPTHTIYSFMPSSDSTLSFLQSPGEGHELGSCFKWCTRFISCVPVLVNHVHVLITRHTDRPSWKLCSERDVEFEFQIRAVLFSCNQSLKCFQHSGGVYGYCCLIQTLFKTWPVNLSDPSSLANVAPRKGENTDEMCNFMNEY